MKIKNDSINRYKETDISSVKTKRTLVYMQMHTSIYITDSNFDKKS